MRSWGIFLIATLCFYWSPASSAICGKVFWGESGIFSSPNYPKPYPHRSDCIYIVVAAPDARTQLTCKSSIEVSKGCIKDYLRLNESLYCGSKCPKGLIIEGSFSLEFHSDAKINKPGFQCHFLRLLDGDYIEATTQTSMTSSTIFTRSIRSATLANFCSSVLVFKNSWNTGWDGKFYIPITKYISDWTLEVAFDKKIDVFEVWSADIAVFSDFYVILTPKYYNSNIRPGSRLIFDFLYRFKQDSDIPAIISIKLNGEEVCSDQGKSALCYDCDYCETAMQTSVTSATHANSCSSLLIFDNSWNAGWDGKIDIPITKYISDWTLEVTFDKKIDVFEVWSADIVVFSDFYVSLIPKHYNRNIRPGSRLIFDFVYRFQQDSDVPVIISIKLNGEELCRNMVTTATSVAITTSVATIPSLATRPSLTTTTGSLTSCTNVPYNYDEVLHKSLLFYEAQRSGDLPKSQRVTWRKDSALGDAKDADFGVQIDLEGGYYDAGGYMKYGFPMAGATTLLAWGAIENRKAYEAAGEWNHMKEAVKWAADYFIKAHVSSLVFYGQVGLGDLDHDYWGRPEDMTMERPAFKITKEEPGSDLAGETAAALAAVSILFRDSDATYANLCLEHAKELYNFANRYRGKYSDSISDARDAYESSGGYGDELAWAAVWLYRAANDSSYLTKAIDHYSEFGLNKLANEFSWEEKTPGVQVLLAHLTNDQIYITAITNFCDSIVNTKPRTPKGLVYISKWGSLGYASNAVFICLRAADQGIKPETYRDLAKEQIHYILGDAGRSFVVGFGNNPPQRPQHASSSCPSTPATCNWPNFDSPGPNSHVLEGALVGGPDIKDFYDDNRNDYNNVVTCDFNAGFQSAVAELRRFFCD